MRPFALLLCVSLVAASSYPDTTSCVAEDEAGLTVAMGWVEPAVRTDAYTLRTGDGCDRSKDPTSYVPGQFTSIHLRTHKYKGQFRGLLIYATDATQKRVGDWQLDWPNSNMFWKPQGACQNVSLMHLNGAEKFYHHEFKFIAPPAGTGTIEFHTLIKRGEANTGEFYYANLDKNLMLAESSASAPTVWVEGAKGATCDATCTSVSRPCDSLLYNNVFKWSTALQKDVLLSVGCASPGLASKDAKTVSKDDAGWCTYPSFDAQVVEGACSAAPPAGTIPICPCGSATQPSFGPNVPPPDTACLNEFIVMGSASKSSSTSLSLLLVLLTGAFLNQHKHGNSMFTFFCVLFCAYTVQAHNWVYSVSRSFNQASTYKPCRPKVSEVPHWQINQGQEFWMEWATGHDHYFYFTVVHADDILLLETTTQNHLDNYIKACDARPTDDYMRGKVSGTGTAPGKHWAKQHINHDPRAKTTTISMGSTPGEIYARNISEGDPLFFQRHEKFGIDSRAVRWVYNDAFTSKDMRCSYFNSDYPHIVAVHRFVQVETVESRAGDRDTARFTIDVPTGYTSNNGRRAEGQYIVQYLWRGYFDCADIDVFTSTPVADVGGRPLRPDEPQWNKVDHCQFEEIQNLETSCTEVVTHASRCLDECVDRMNCGGVNVVPMWLPKTVYPLFSNRVGIPFDDMSNRCPRARFAGLSRDGRVCYGVLPRLPNNTHAMYSVTDDPEDPLFYSTCFIKRSQWAFDLSLGNSSALIPVPPSWAFGNKCVDCMEWKASQENFNVPTWKLPETCVNCEAAAAAGLLPPVPELPGKLISRGYKCDGFYESKTVWRFQQKTAECSTVKCVKSLTMAGANAIQADECLAKARADPQCSDVVMHRGNGQSRACECYIKAEVEPCCGTCAPVDADFQTSRGGKISEWNIYSVAPPKSDPTCARGVPSADGAYCCSASCKDANGVGMCMPKPALQISFQDSALVAPDGWGVDNGLLFGTRTNPSYSSTLSTQWGWNCLSNVASVNYRDRDTEDGTNFHGTTIRAGSSSCPNPEWSVEVLPGVYHVDTLYSDPNQNLRGCKIQGINNFEPTKLSLGSSDMVWVSRVVTVNATGTKISLTGGSNSNCGGYSAVVIYPKTLVPSDTSCQSLPGMCCPLFIDMEHRPCSDYEAPCKL